MRFLPFACLALLLTWVPAYAVESLPEQIKSLLGAGPVVEIAGEKIAAQPLLAFYESREYAPRWFGLFGLKGEAKDALTLIARAEEHGLSPNRYHSARIATIMEQGIKGDGGAAQLELLISDAVMRYAHDVHYGATPREQEISWGKSTPRLSYSEVLAEAANARDLKDYLTEAPPQGALYAGLMQLLRDYRALEKNGGWPSFAAGKKLSPGETDARVKKLRRILFILGDLAAEGEGDRYDEALAGAVKSFQTRHGLVADGIIGQPSAVALNTSVRTRIAQIIATMERLRWLPKQEGERQVVVNIPAFALYAYRNGKTEITSRVITGTVENQTPTFGSVIDAVSFNPPWYVPKRIAREEMIALIKEDPEYLTRGNYTLKVHDEEGTHEMAAEDIDWEAAAADPDFRFSIKQEPGLGNALGKVKFNVQDSNAIYLHSTSTPRLFEKSVRAFSHGCIRVDKARELMYFLMEGNDKWDKARIDALYDSDESRIISISPVPVQVVYHTAWRDDKGRANFRADIYKHDEALAKALRQ